MGNSKVVRLHIQAIETALLYGETVSEGIMEMNDRLRKSHLDLPMAEVQNQEARLKVLIIEGCRIAVSESMDSILFARKRWNSELGTNQIPEEIRT